MLIIEYIAPPLIPIYLYDWVAHVISPKCLKGKIEWKIILYQIHSTLYHLNSNYINIVGTYE